MDSLAVSAIGLAAGGWQNVKLTGIYNSITNSIPTWKLGICSVLSLLANRSIQNSSGSVGGTRDTVLISPGSILSGYSDSTACSITFETNRIKHGESRGLTFTAVLFTW